MLPPLSTSPAGRVSFLLFSMVSDFLHITENPRPLWSSEIAASLSSHRR